MDKPANLLEFKRRKEAIREGIFCDEGAEFRENYLRNTRAVGARERLASRLATGKPDVEPTEPPQDDPQPE